MVVFCVMKECNSLLHQQSLRFSSRGAELDRQRSLGPSILVESGHKIPDGFVEIGTVDAHVEPVLALTHLGRSHGN